MAKIRQLSAQALRDMRRAIEMREKAIAMREQALDTRLRVWLNRLNTHQKHTQDCALQLAVDAALSVASADYANIQLIDPRGGGLILKAQRGFKRDFLDFFQVVNDEHTACGFALKEQRVIVVQDITYSPVFNQPKGLEVLLDAGVRAVKSAPLIGSHGEILGILSVHYRKPHNHIDAEILRFQTLAAAVAAAIDHARKPEFAHGL